MIQRREFLELCAGAAAGAAFRIQARESALHVVIAGGGILGASIAWHLAQQRARVTLLEKSRPAAGATQNSFAWINSTYSKQPRPYYELNLLGMAGWRRLDSAFGGELKIQWGGSCEWYPPGADAEQLVRDVRRHQQWGYATRLVTSNEFRRLLPNISAGPYAAGSFCDAEGTLDPVHATRTLLDHAKGAGADVQYPCEIKSLDISGGRVRAVETSKGRVEADVFVLACGNDTPQLANLAGVNVPLVESPGVLAHTAPQPKLLDRIALAPGAHIKQLWDGRIVTGSSFGGTTTRDASREMGQGLIREAARFLSHLKDVTVDRVTLGWRVLPKDELPIIGFSDRCPNLYITAMHSGVTLAPIVGQLAATEILDSARVELLEPFRPARFH